MFNEKLIINISLFFYCRPGFRFGARLPARAVRALRNEMGSSRSYRSRDSRAHSAQECFNVLLFFGIVDICQNYNIRKRLEHACKSIKYDSKSINTVNPKAYSSRFQEFISQIFLPEESDEFADGRYVLLYLVDIICN